MITISLEDSAGSLTLPEIEVPLTEQIIESATDVTTLDNNIYTEFTNQKRSWSLVYDSLTDEEYEAVKAFYDRQFTDNLYPSISIDFYNIEQIPVRMYLNPRQVYNHCGSVEDVEISFRETTQLTGGGSS